MPRYHLHICSETELILDEEGIDLPHLAAAKLEAIRGARSIMSADLLVGMMTLGQSIQIHDEFGTRLSEIPYAECVKIVPARIAR